MRRTTIAFACALLLSGCSAEVSEFDLAQAEHEEHLQSQYEPTEEQLQDEADAAYEQHMAESSVWICFWDPTMNNNWHDDVLCRAGNKYVRPNLLSGSGFVTKDEMIAAGHKYEAKLNSKKIDRPSWVDDPNVQPPSWGD
jgi:uncharacterized protein YceK